MRVVAAPPEFRIKRVENLEKWFRIGHHCRSANVFIRDELVLRHVQPAKWFRVTDEEHSDHVALVRKFYPFKLGQVGSHWRGSTSLTPFEVKYANIEFADLFEFYTTADGVLRLPDWSHLKCALDQFLVEDPRVKYHPSRVRRFIEEHGIDELERMQ